MFRATRSVLAVAKHADNKAFQSLRTKVSTGVTGLDVHSAPFPALIHTYTSTLALLQSIPASAVYRQSVEAITRERLEAVKSVGEEGTEEQIEQLEQRLQMGQVEELIIQAQEELKLAGKIIEWKAYVPFFSFPSLV
jgi:NADH dehydrogenase (ubiquinone) 1 alpha subcomplex subunit 5